MTQWLKINPTFASHIRVNRGFYYHHGIYLDDNTVVSFGGINNDYTLDPSKARVIITSLNEFLRGGELEVRQFSDEELKRKRTPQDIANYALSCVGNSGYDLINNNCEHFANECLFGKRESEQVKNIINHFFG